MKIFKYPIDVMDGQTVKMPKDALPLKAALDPRGKLCIWAMVEPDAELEERIVAVIGTGKNLPSILFEIVPSEEKQFWHLDTVVCGDEVWHVFIR